MRKEHFDLFCSLMRLSYNDRHLELVAWAEDAAQLTREQQRAFLRDAARLLRESFMLHAGIREVSYLWGEELAFCSKFAPFVGPLIAEIESAAAQIAQNGNPTIVFTHFALSVSKMIKHL
jgi:DNA polymerase-3 subunit delta'